MKKQIKKILNKIANSTGYLFFAVVIASIVVRILQSIDKFLF